MADCCGDNRFTLIERVKQDFIENTNISDAEIAVLDSMCFRMWQLGLLKKYDNIDEEKLDKLTDEYFNYERWSGYDGLSLVKGFKDGYRKAMEYESKD